MKAKSSNLLVGTHRANRRIWMQGNNLLHAGFDVGKFYSTKIYENHIRLEISDNGDKKVSRKKKKVKGVETYEPVIELCNKTITDFFINSERCKVLYWPDCVILITHPETNLEAELEQLENKQDKAA